MEPSAASLLAPLAPWFDAVRRPLPWRAGDLDAPHPDPYAVLVSELMLQQTQVATVIPYFERWMARFPDAQALAGASEEAVHALWAGLGYYRRARNLQAAARAVAEGGFPRDLAGLQALPGLGPYTAAAVAAQAFQLPAPALDGNAFRVTARLLGLREDPRRLAAELRAWLIPALEAHGPSRMTQALMELGATVCVPAARCGACPLAEACEARRLGLQAVIPPAQPKAKVTEVDLVLAAIRHGDAWLLRPPAARGLLAGLWSWPAAPIAAGDGPSPTPPMGWEATLLPGWTQVYTHRRERVRPLLVRAPELAAPQGFAWVPAERLGTLPLGRRDQRLRSLLEGPAGLLPPDGETWAALLRLLG